ncbi:MAG: tRNA pseudouridine(55) synthase TruB, partial [Rhodocyclaceae bacterium]|nr:tRNA pseudouridine(55) synthase TruB [Rhodocyclaceae bacterium]
MTARSRWRAVDGLLLLDKPSGITSNAALQRARRVLQAEKAGHTGTLDPLASGLLPLCFGQATKFARFLLDADKRYTATVAFGLTTTTGDSDGEPLERRPVAVDEPTLRTVLARFTGAIEQVPPMYSALKRDGRPLYDYARAGIEVERAARPVTLHAIDLLAFDGAQAVLDVSCSKGTYIRVLAEDIGAALGCGAHLAGLRRTATSGWRADEAVALAEFEALTPDAVEA